jgi:surfeit locus 1 family protein
MAKYSPVLRIGRWRLALQARPTLAMLAAVALFSALGVWQLDRAAGKRALVREFERPGAAVALPADETALATWLRVYADGRYLPERQFLHDNRGNQGRAGVEVLTPLLLPDGSAVLVNRGWLPYGRTRQDLPDIVVGAEARRVTGRWRELPRTPIELEAPAGTSWPRLIQYPREAELAAMLGRRLRPGLILLDPADVDGYARNWLPVGTPPVRHLGYAIQWFAFAVAAIAIWAALALRRGREAP